MEQKLDELLKQIHRYLFADSEQIIVELKQYLLDRNLKEAELAFISAKIFNSKESLLQFLRENFAQNERILATVKKRIYELIIDYMKLRRQEVSHYLKEIKETCMISFFGDPNYLVKEAGLQVLIKIIESFDTNELLPIIQPVSMLDKLLDEIKLRKPSASVKGAIWQLVGLIHHKYDNLVNARLVESQDVCLQSLQDQVKASKPEIKAIIGMIKGLTSMLSAGCTLNDRELQSLYIMIKTVIKSQRSQEDKEMNNRGIMKAGMKLLAQHANLITDQILKDALDLIKETLKLCVLENIEVRDSANELLFSLLNTISDYLQASQDSHVELFRHIMSQFDEILNANDYRNMQLLSAIRAVGIFSKAIKRINGDEKLWDYLERLTEISEQKLIKEFMDQQNPESDLHNFKYILKKQKQLIAYIESYSFIIRNLSREPSEKQLQHFTKIASIGVNNHRKLYQKYRYRFYESLAQLSMSLSGFSGLFGHWIKKFVRLSLTETLKIPDSVIFGGESPVESLNDAVQFWCHYLTKDEIWTIDACQTVYDELINTALNDIESMNLTYKVQKISLEKEDFAITQQSQFEAQESQRGVYNKNTVEYIANNQNDQSYLVRLTNFLEGFLPQCHEEWLLKWVPNICQTLVKKSTQTPRVSKLYTLLKTVLMICSRQQYFDKPIAFDNTGLVGAYVVQKMQRHAQMESERQNTFNMLLTYLKELIGKSEEFQDNLLTAVMEMLLHVPISILYTSPKNRSQAIEDKVAPDGSQNENIHLWKGVMIKALELSHINNRLAMTCIKMLERWFNTLPVSVTADLYSDVVPKLSDFLIIQESVLGKTGEINPDEDYFERDGDAYTETYFFQEKLIEDREELRKIDRRDIANKVLDLLGKIGGHAHSIINNELTKKHDKENVIRWDTEKRLKLKVPLHNTKVEIYLDSCLPRIVDLAQNSTDKLTRIAACELLHALILYMIGKSATNPIKNAKKAKKGADNQADSAVFAKLYAKLFPVIIRLATEIEQISRQLFEPLCFQIVRWFSSCKIYENAAVESLLDALIDGAQSRNNSTLREMCSNAVAVFAEWSLHGKTEAEISENQSNIKSLIRRIESNSNHPDPFKRLSAVLCFSKIFTVIKDYDPLVDQFILEITRCVLSSLKMCHNTLEFSQEVIDNCSQLLKVIEKQIGNKFAILLEPNPARQLHASLYEFLDFIFSKFISVETVYRHECMALWEGLVAQLPQPKGSSSSTAKTIQNWVKTRYVPKAGKKPIYWNLGVIDFAPLGSLSQGPIGPFSQQDSRKGKLQETKKCFDQFTAQLEFIHWLLKVAKFNFNELQSSLRIEIVLVAMNLRNLFDNVIWPIFTKVSSAAQNQKSFSLTKLLICKEDKEQLTKSKIRMLTKLFTLINFLDDQSLDKFMSYTNGDDCDMTGHDNLNECLFDLALQICLVPACHQLQLLVQDLQLEKKLREQCELFIKRKFADLSARESSVSTFDSEPRNLLQILEQRITPKLPFADLNMIIKAQNDLQPRLLSNLCQGYLNLAAIDKHLKQQLIKLASSNLTTVIDECSAGNTPLENESCRLLVNFMSKLKIPNETLFSWLTEKYQIYQKASDLLLAYIAENWQSEPEQVGDYLVNKAGEDMKILQVFIPIIQHISQHTPGYQRVLLKKIPEYWKSVNFTEGYAENQVKIYSLIVSQCKWTLEGTQDQDVTTFINFICIQVMIFLNNTKFSVYLKKQVLNLAGLLYSLKLSEKSQTVHLKLKDSLLNVQKEFFPIKTRELAKNSNKAINFEHIVEGFLDLVDISKNLDVLRMLYKCIREMKPAFFSERLKSTVNNLILQSINSKEDLSDFFSTVDSFMREFTSYDLDLSIDDNIRWAIAHKIIQRVLETCSLAQLEHLMVKYHSLFKQILDKSLQTGPVALSEELQQEAAQKRYMVIREKTHVFLYLEAMVRRLDAEVLKSRITQAIYGSQCQANELTKYLILTANEAKQQTIDQFCDRRIECELSFLNSPGQVHRRFNCAAYTLLSSVILKTQTKEHLFTSYLFKNQRMKESVWQLLVDCSSEDVYQFVVQTNFNFINLQSYENKHTGTKQFSRANLMLQEYVTTSFMSANEKFNSAMVFETQLDEESIQTEKKKVNELLRKKMRFFNLPQQLQHSGQGESQNYFLQEGDQNDVEEPEMDKPDLTLELDSVNKHECMKNIKRCFVKMQELFTQDWLKNGPDQPPAFMQELAQEIDREDCHLNIRIFILKLLVNNSTLFKPYAAMWFEPICKFITYKQTGGKGFHYFLRDLTTLLIQWSDIATPHVASKAMKELCSKVINTLIKMSADKSKLIFNINIEIVATLLHNWRHLVTIDKVMIVKMLSTPETVEGGHIWKMTAIQIIALACSFNVPVLSPQEIQYLKDEDDHSHEFRIFEDTKKRDELLVALIKMQELRKKPLIFASSEALGKLFTKQPSLVEIVLPALMVNEARDRHDIFVNVIERVTREFPQLCNEKKLFVKLVAFINVFTGSMRGSVFKTLERYIQICSPEAVVEISRSLMAVANSILADISEENQQNFLLLSSTIVRQHRESGFGLLSIIAPKLKGLFSGNKNELTRGLYFDLMVFVYENLPEFKVVAKSSIIRGLSDQSKDIRDRIIAWWNNPARLDLDPFMRVEQLLTEIYDQDEEHIWLNNAIYLLLQLSERTPDFLTKIFDFPLSDCKFDPLSISHFSSSLIDSRQQPVTSSYALMQQMVITASQAQIHNQNMIARVKPTALQDIKEEDAEMLDLTEDHEEQIDTSVKVTESQGPSMVQASQQQRLTTRIGGVRNNSSLVAHRFNQLTMHASQGVQASPPQRQHSTTTAFFEGGIRGPQIKGSGTGSSSGFTLVKAPKLTDDEADEVKGSQEEFHIMKPMSDHQQNKSKPDSIRSQFFTMNEIKYTPIQESQSNMIRYIPDGSMPSQLARKEEKRRIHREQMIKRQLALMNKQVNLMRQYRVGDLPDIQIDYKDVLLPLMAIVRRDSTIATEIFVELFTEIYTNTLDDDRRHKLGKGVSDILVQSVKYDYGVINCMHRVAIELLKIDHFSIDAEVIARTGKHSMSFQTALILLEETILHGQVIKDAEVKNALQQNGKRQANQRNEREAKGQQSLFAFGKITKASKAYWFKLIELYELIGNDDALKGIWRSMGDSDRVLLKDNEEQEMLDETTYQDTVELLKRAQSLRAKGSISDGLKVIEKALSSKELQVYFEEQVLSEQHSKRFESMSDLLKWDQIAEESLKIHHSKQLYELPLQQSEVLIRAMLRKDENWTKILAIRNEWLQDPLSQQILDKRFNFEQALLFITESDFDRARFFINKEANDLISQWQDMTKLSQVAQHILVQKIQKIYEMKEFLQVTKLLSIKGQNEMLPVINEQVHNWVQRQPSYSFDKLAIWDDILTARKLYLRCYDMLLSKPDEQVFSKSQFGDIGAILYAQCAKGAFRMGMFDSCVRYLHTCLEQRSKENKNNLQIILPIIKLKTEQFKQETANLDSQTKFEKLKDIKVVLESKLQQAGKLHYSHGVQINTKAYLLKEAILKKLINLTLVDIREQKPSEQSEELLNSRLASQIKEAFKSFDDYQVSIGAFEESQANYVQVDSDMKRAKTSFCFAKLCDRLLRKMEQSPLLHKSISQSLSEVPIFSQETRSKKKQAQYEALACMSIKLSFQAMNLGYLRASDSIPRLLDVASSKGNSDRVGIEFGKCSKDTPAWIFLSWVNQIVAVINKPEGQIVAEKVRQIARKYPQALYYPFNVIASNIEVNTLNAEIVTTELFNVINKYYSSKFENLNSWTESLSCLVNPEHRSIQWLQMILDVLQDSNWKSKATQLIGMFMADCATEERKFIGAQIGSYNRKFAQWIGQELEGKNLQALSQDKLEREIKSIFKKICMLPLLQGEKDLWLFSEYLNELDNNDFYNPDQYIEVPGQLEGALLQEPIASKNVKIASVRKKILVLGSIRRPKKLTVHGSNEKDYHLLIKGGEDLRLDQRIQQVFQIMNKVFKVDPSCQNRDISLKTFKVVPVTNRLGTLEWVENTEMLKSIINREYARVTAGTGKLGESKSLSHIRETIKKEWLRKIPGNEDIQDIVGQHLKLLEVQSSIVINAFKKQQQLIPWHLLRTGLENLCLTSQAFITIKNQFVKSIAVFSIASYLIGIGDRHLENFLVDITDGEVLGIDFGIAFGSGVDLTTPELMPFRLTQQIEGVIAPHPLEGAYKQTMVHTLRALRKHKSLILDTCDIFVKEPLLDWTKEAKKKLHQQLQEGDSVPEKSHEREMESLSFLPKQKIDKVKKKITGVNPVLILKQELSESSHANKKYYKQLVETIQGPPGSARNTLLAKKKTYLDVEEQVDCLIEAARDPDVLGRVWLGWSAYI